MKRNAEYNCFRLFGGNSHEEPLYWSWPGPRGEEQKRVAQAYIAQLDAAKVYSRPIVTKVEPFQAFYPAENHHQDFLKNNPDNPYIIYNDLPKLKNLEKDFPEFYKP